MRRTYVWRLPEPWRQSLERDEQEKTGKSKYRVTARMKAWIENGDQLMPPFKDVLDAGQINDVIAYVKTL